MSIILRMWHGWFEGLPGYKRYQVCFQYDLQVLPDCIRISYTY